VHRLGRGRDDDGDDGGKRPMGRQRTHGLSGGQDDSGDGRQWQSQQRTKEGAR
jgi:hypothetical protein